MPRYQFETDGQINSTSQTILEALLPSHMAAISACFEDRLVQSTDEERQATLTRLSRLQRLIPAWPGMY